MVGRLGRPVSSASRCFHLHGRKEAFRPGGPVRVMDGALVPGRGMERTYAEVTLVSLHATGAHGNETVEAKCDELKSVCMYGLVGQTPLCVFHLNGAKVEGVKRVLHVQDPGLFVYLFTYLFVCCLFIHLLFVCFLFGYLVIYLFVYIYLFICLFIHSFILYVVFIHCFMYLSSCLYILSTFNGLFYFLYLFFYFFLIWLVI